MTGESPIFTSSGWRLPFFGKGNSPLLAANHEATILALNALGKIEIKVDPSATTPRVLYSDANIVLLLPATLAGGTSGVGQLETYRVKSKAGDVLTCRTWDGANEGETNIQVAVNRNSRQLASEVIEGTTYTYTGYTAVGSYNTSRNSNDGDTDETQIVTPMWYSDCEIDVMRTDYSGVAGTAGDIKLIEVSARCWAKVEPPT